jgi:hypothetical protein
LTSFHANHLSTSITYVDLFDVAVAIGQTLRRYFTLNVIVSGVLGLAKHWLTSGFVVIAI